jgi:hypothetical protein
VVVRAGPARQCPRASEQLIAGERLAEVVVRADQKAGHAVAGFGGIYEVVYTRVLRGEIRQRPRLLPDLVYSALLPYLGPEAAAAERRRLIDAQQAA